MPLILRLTFVALLFVSATVIAHADPLTLTFAGIGSTNIKFSSPIALPFVSKGIYDTSMGVMKYEANGIVDLLTINADDSSPTKGLFTLSDGNSLMGKFTGSLFPVDANGIARAVLTYTITGGTGIFNGVIGTGTEEVFLNFATGTYTSKGSLLLNMNTNAVPEPTSLLLLGSGLAGLAMRLRKKGNL